MFKQLVSLLILSGFVASCEFLEATNNSGNRSDDNGRVTNQPPATACDPSDVTLESVLLVQMLRNPGTAQYSHNAIKEVIQKNDGVFPDNIIKVPDPAIDYEELATPPVPAKDCGYNIDLDEDEELTIDARKDDCVEKNKGDEKAIRWNGKSNGSSGEGMWELVIKRSGKSLWQDMSTGLLWSPPSTNPVTWSLASGNGASEDIICDGENDITSERLNFLGMTPEEVVWRLPTRNDFLQADINGSRFVIAEKDDNTVFWTANYIKDETQAWAIQLNKGVLKALPDTASTLMNVRCVGVALK
ncbi:MAG: hypothetical protein WD025_08985 [Bacteriovoracaceae bacterium]